MITAPNKALEQLNFLRLKSWRIRLLARISVATWKSSRMFTNVWLSFTASLVTKDTTPSPIPRSKNILVKGKINNDLLKKACHFLRKKASHFPRNSYSREATPLIITLHYSNQKLPRSFTTFTTHLMSTETQRQPFHLAVVCRDGTLTTTSNVTDQDSSITWTHVLAHACAHGHQTSSCHSPSIITSTWISLIRQERPRHIESRKPEERT